MHKTIEITGADFGMDPDLASEVTWSVIKAGPTLRIHAVTILRRSIRVLVDIGGIEGSPNEELYLHGVTAQLVDAVKVGILRAHARGDIHGAVIVKGDDER